MGRNLLQLESTKRREFGSLRKACVLFSFSMVHRSITNASNDCRWSQEVRHHSQVDTATMSTMSLGIQHTPSFSVHRVRRTGGLSSGMPDVSCFALQFLE